MHLLYTMQINSYRRINVKVVGAGRRISALQHNDNTKKRLRLHLTVRYVFLVCVFFSCRSQSRLVAVLLFLIDACVCFCNSLLVQYIYALLGMNLTTQHAVLAWNHVCRTCMCICASVYLY